MSGVILPGEPQGGAPNEMNVVVNVNNQPTPLPIAKLIVLNEVAEQLKRIANSLEAEFGGTDKTGPK